MTSTMTREQAEALRAAQGTDARLLSRKRKHELVAIYQSEGGYGGGTWSKDDLAGSILEMRFPLARQNEAIHVLHHNVPWPDCKWCQEVADSDSCYCMGGVGPHPYHGAPRYGKDYR